MLIFEGYSGSSADNAIIIKGAKDELEGIEGEYIWIEENLGEHEVDWHLVDQKSIDLVEKKYDVIKLKLADSAEREIWFDITEFYGK